MMDKIDDLINRIEKLYKKTKPEQPLWKYILNKEYKEYKKLPEDESTKKLFDLLYNVTEIQDRIQLSIPIYNPSVTLSKQITNHANALMLEISKYRGDIRPFLTHGYGPEKIRSIVKAYNDVVHDYNLTVESGFFDKFQCDDITERTEPSASVKESKQYFYNNGDKIWIR